MRPPSPPATTSRTRWRWVDELVAAGDQIADSFAAVKAHQLGRTGTRSDGARFTVETFARYLIHDPVHHLWDVRPDNR